MIPLLNRLMNRVKVTDRRTQANGVKDDRRTSATHRLNAASDRVDAAIDDLCKTVSMSRSDFNAMIERDRIQDVIEFASFASKCEYRYINGDGHTHLCRNPDHEKICTGHELCAQIICPRLRKQE